MHVGGPGIVIAVVAVVLSSLTSLHDLFHSTTAVVARDVGVALAVVFWLGLAYWVNKDTRRRIGAPLLVGLATLVGLVPLVGPIVYLLFRPAETLDDVRSRRIELQALEQQLTRSQPACPVCTSPVEPDFLACPVCTTMLRQPCATCRAPLEPLWQICPYCTSPAVPRREDLDAALAAEAAKIALVETAVPLLPPAQPSTADA